MEILVAIITGLIALVGTIITVSASNNKVVTEIAQESALNDAEIKGEIALVRKDVQNLSEQITRMQSLYSRVTALERRADVAKNRIMNLGETVAELDKTAARKRSYKPPEMVEAVTAE